MNRTNTITGIPYRDDPTIMAWQLANEPRPGRGKAGIANFIAMFPLFFGYLFGIMAPLAEATDAASTDVEGLALRVVASSEEKCERCWHWEADVGANDQHPTLCGRCVTAVEC